MKWNNVSVEVLYAIFAIWHNMMQCRAFKHICVHGRTIEKKWRKKEEQHITELNKT